MTKNIISKTCSVCGLDKPMSAFLQIAGPEGTTYGNICSTCRGSGLGRKTEQEPEDFSTDSTGHKIDSKTKVKYDTDKKLGLDLKTALEEKEKQKRSEVVNDLEEKKLSKVTQEKRHRAEFLESKKTKSSFLNYQSQKNPAQTTREEQLAPSTTANLAQEAAKEALAREAGISMEQANTTVNLTHIYFDPSLAGQVRHHSAQFLQAKAALLGGAPVSRQEASNNNAHAQEQQQNFENKTQQERKLASQSRSVFSQTSPQEKEDKTKVLNENLNKNFRDIPTSRRGR